MPSTSKIMYVKEMATVWTQFVAECYLAPFAFVHHYVNGDDDDGFGDGNVNLLFGVAKGVE